MGDSVSEIPPLDFWVRMLAVGAACAIAGRVIADLSWGEKSALRAWWNRRKSGWPRSMDVTPRKLRAKDGGRGELEPEVIPPALASLRMAPEQVHNAERAPPPAPDFVNARLEAMAPK